MKATLLFTWLLLPAIASTQVSANTQTFLYGIATYDLFKSYGITFGSSMTFTSTRKEKTDNKFNSRASRRRGVVSIEGGAYRDPFDYSAILVNAGIGLRYNKSVNYFTELYFNQGIFRTIYDGKVYELGADGNIKEIKLAGLTYLTSGFSWSANWNLSKKKPGVWFFETKPAFWVQYPYNSFLKPHLSLQAGISYHLKKNHFS